MDAPARVAESTKVRAAPSSYDDHFSQVRLFWRSMTPVEQEHIVLAYTFELGKCYEQAIKERQLLALAHVDATLCSRVAEGIGLPAPETTGQDAEAATVETSPALSQIGGTWPVDGRMVGIVVDGSSDLDAVEAARTAVKAAGMVPVLVAPNGGAVGDSLEAQRTFATVRSVELDAVVLAGAALDDRVVLLVDECFRHGKAIGAWAPGTQVLESSRVAQAVSPGVVVGESATEVVEGVVDLLGSHRVWHRFPGDA